MTHGPAFQFYPNDWMGSTKIAMMSLAEQGAFLRLLCHCWNDPDCTLADDDEELALLSHLGKHWLKGSGAKLRKCFVPHPKKVGRLFNVRLLGERKKQEAWHKKSRKGGIQSGKTRALQAQAQGRVVEGWLTDGSTKREPKANSSSSSSSSSSKEEKENTYIMCNGHAWEEGFKQFWAAYPRKQHRGNAEAWFKKNRPTAELVDKMITKIREFTQTDAWQEDKGRFVPLPKSWLDAKGWEDQARIDLPRKPRVLIT